MQLFSGIQLNISINVGSTRAEVITALPREKKIMNVRKSKFAILMVLPIRFIFDILSEHTREMKA